MAKELLMHVLTPEELTRELEARAHDGGAIVVLTLNQWKSVTDAYVSPLMGKVTEDIIQVFPRRSVDTKILSFGAFAREFKR